MAGRTPLACLVILAALASVLLFGTGAASASITCTECASPQISLSMSGPSYGNAGQQATYDYNVTNSGSVDITQVALTDDSCSPVTGPAGDVGDDGVLSPGESWSYSCTTTLAGNPGDSIQHHANVTGSDGASADAYWTTTITDLRVVKTVDKTTADPYDDLNYTITVSNNGPNYLAYQGYLSDSGCDGLQAQSGNTEGTYFYLYPGDSAVYTCHHNFNPGSGEGQDPNPYVNEACADASASNLEVLVSRTPGYDIHACGSASTALAQHSASGTIFEDMNADGARQFDEPGIAGVRVYADQNHNGVFDEGEPSTRSDDQGKWSLPVGLGFTTLREDVPAGSTCSYPNACAYNVSLPKNSPPPPVSQPSRARAADPTGRDFGNWRPASVSGTVVNDANGNGLQEATEGGLGGVTVYADLNGNGGLDGDEPSGTTNAAGSYVLSGLKPGGYSIRHVLVQDGRTCSAPVGCSHSVTLASNQNVGGRDFLDAPAAGQAVLPERIVRIPGVASLKGRTGCVSGKGFTAVVRGKAMSRFVMLLDGQVVRAVSLPVDSRPYRFRVNVSKLEVGKHQLAVQVVFRQASQTKNKTMRLSFQRCAAQLRAPAFTG